MSRSSRSSRVILVADGNMSYASPYHRMATELDLGFTTDAEALNDKGRVALVLFTGGEDVGPNLYNMTAHHTTFDSPRRDRLELAIFKKAHSLGLPFVGICRGAQFLCVMAGGSLVQDITGHGGRDHQLRIKQQDGSTKDVLVNSSHHQMQNPFNLTEGEDYELIGWMPEPISRHYALDADTVVPAAGLGYSGIRLEPDIVYYPKLKALAAQYHPEWLSKDHEGFLAYEALLEQYIRPLVANDDENRTEAA